MPPESDRCRHCGKPARCPEIVPYLVKKGQKYGHIWLHPECSEAWHRRYRAWRRNRSSGNPG